MTFENALHGNAQEIINIQNNTINNKVPYDLKIEGKSFTSAKNSSQVENLVI